MVTYPIGTISEQLACRRNIYDYDLYQFANDLAKQYKDCAGAGAGDEV